MLRDIQWLRYRGLNNGASVYWKTSKPMADGISAHMKDSVIARLRNLQPGMGGGGIMMGPAGPFTMLLDNLTFVREEGDTDAGGLIKIGQHCGLSGYNGGTPGQFCSVQYFLKNMDWSHIPADTAMQRIRFGVSGGNQHVPILTTNDDSLDGAQSLISPLLDGFAALPGCSTTTKRWSFATACADRARRLVVYPKPYAQWAPDAAGLPTQLPHSLHTTGEHEYNGQTYYVYCAFNGCRPWNKDAWDRYIVPPATQYDKWKQRFDVDQGRDKLYWFAYAQLVH